MTKEEDLVLDELYFVTSFDDLLEQSGFVSKKDLVTCLASLLAKRWIKCLSDPETEIDVSVDELELNYAKYYYLASKQGLLAHNLK